MRRVDNVRSKIRISIPLICNYKVKGYDVAEELKKYRTLTKSDIRISI